MLNAAGLTDPESRRYALGCIRLRGSDGQVAGTDGRQAFVHNGFSLPAGEILVPATAIKNFSTLTRANAISVGLRDDWVALRVGTNNARWSLDIKRQSTGRFPELDRCIPSLADSQARLTLSEADALFLIEQLKRLSPDRCAQGPITLELGSVPNVRMRLRSSEYNRLFSPGQMPTGDLRGAEEPAYRVCEIHLDASTRSGVELRCAVDHLHMLALLRFGFRQIEFQSERAPVYCIDHNRSFVCAVSCRSFVLDSGVSDLRLTCGEDARVA